MNVTFSPCPVEAPPNHVEVKVETGMSMDVDRGTIAGVPCVCVGTMGGSLMKLIKADIHS